MFRVVLYQPEIPPNTGNIIRLCANTGVELHLIQPLGFSWDDKLLKRAGLDYHEHAQVRLHDRWSTTWLSPRLFACTTKGATRYTDARFQPGDTLLFGPETRGLPDEVRQAVPAEQRLKIPMHPSSRSLNLANSVAVIVYEAWRQCGFEL